MPGLRDFITALDKHGYLRHVQNPVDWKHEIGAIARASSSPLLFENIKDYPGRTVFTNGLANYSAMALALGIQKDGVRRKDLCEKIKRAFAAPIEPSLISWSPLMENRITQGLDLTTLPIPWWSEIDSGRYLGTWHVNISRDLETGIRNIGVYRMQVLTPNKTTLSVSPHAHLARQIAKAEDKNEPFPVVAAIGVDERLIISAAAAPPYGIDEYDLAGGLIGKPIKLIKCMSQPLEVPADAEIAVEGFVHPRVRVQDGPFLDYAGVPSINTQAYLFEATALLFRNSYIFRGTAVGKPGAEDHQMYSVLAKLNMVDFHGSRIRHAMQSFLLRIRAFRVLQFTGRVGNLTRKSKNKQRQGAI